MKKGTIAIIVIAGVLLIGAIIWLATSLSKANAAKEAAEKAANEKEPVGQTIVMPADPCADTAQLRIDAEAANKAAKEAAKNAAEKQKKLRNALKKCQPNLQNGDTIYMITIPNHSGNKKSNRGNQGSGPANKQSSSSTTKPGQQVSSSYTGPDPVVITQDYKQSSAGATAFCWNIQADASGKPKGGKFWPHLEGSDPRPFVPEAVSNGGTPVGYNLLMPSAPAFSLSYGHNDQEKVAWCLCSILDNPKFGGTTNVVCAGDLTGWQWLPATIENVGGKSYYVVRW